MICATSATENLVFLLASCTVLFLDLQMIQLALLCESAQICVCVHHGADCVHWDGGPECRRGERLREGEREREIQ